MTANCISNLDTLIEDHEIIVEIEATISTALLEDNNKSISSKKSSLPLFDMIVTGSGHHNKISYSKISKSTNSDSESINNKSSFDKLTLKDGLSSSNKTLSSNMNNIKDCPLCMDEYPEDNIVTIACCNHKACLDCIKAYLRIEIMESRVSISCPECSEMIHPNEIYSLLKNLPELLEKYENFSLRRVLALDPDTRWCPAPDCDYAVIAQSCAACPQLKCGRIECSTLFCYHCKNIWHESQTCDEARRKRMTKDGTSKKGYKRSTPGDKLNRGDVKACPRCKTLIVKMNDGSCNHMNCTVCNTEFCWLCLKEISDLHYLSLSGCSFWGKKPWNRKKKLLWQIGTLIGAPVGIGLIACMAIPGIIGGFPFMVGRKVYQKLSSKSKFQRRFLTSLSVVGGVIASPVLAVMAVGVGVPVLLAYVYGVVPLSICRNGDCGGGRNVEEDDDLSMGSENIMDLFDEDFESVSKSFDRSNNAEKNHSDGNKRMSMNSDISKVMNNKEQGSIKSTLAIKNGKNGIGIDIYNGSRRRISVDSYIIIGEEKTNYDDASVMGMAGIYTINSGAQLENLNNSGDCNSTNALSGFILDNKSLSESANGDNKNTLSSNGIFSIGGTELKLYNGGDSSSTSSSKPYKIIFSGGKTVDMSNYNEPYPYQAKVFSTDTSTLFSKEHSNTSCSSKTSQPNDDPYHIYSVLDRFKSVVSDDVCPEEPYHPSRSANTKSQKYKYSSSIQSIEANSSNEINNTAPFDTILSIDESGATNKVNKKNSRSIWNRIFKSKTKAGSDV
ncbi:Zinc finger, RING-type domain and Zinc finger, C6HC-type domain and Zinc finger, RING/FYVE/PHD-type domain-containing protein [Strongyloides ratti]|uniref:RBR-type E3 ubiquitin transferase n=1 Tax=Strongyloides ratti TaxID=34506 RepID=A0A090MVY3_STRRB|nr:Zinc finger, RING-type domain and Zinc finger, C6HC-type domain and Zinc finger, RING/FYVE/PHD-type domain-containing protein [Strongyloides ratti]CEF63213.1 Zinc finger, RING-type domain and Zinc finger, C6HC-type domain and Zinc finger, RING/FYVE/PHD-type domain-containing protein [Strongyloides ratti]